MIANKEEIRVGQVIVHILDSTVGMPVLSDTVLDYGSDFADFIKAHIFKTDNSDDIRRCVFEEESVLRWQAVLCRLTEMTGRKI